MTTDKKTPLPAEDIDLFEEWEEGGAPSPSPAKKTAPKLKESKEDVKDPVPVVKEPMKKETVKEEVLHMSSDIPVQLVAVIGKTSVSMKELMNYHMGQVIDLGRPPGETVDLVASGKLFARGELVDIDGKLGVRIVKLVE